MADNYKVIRRAQATIKKLQGNTWSANQIVKEIGVSHGLYKDLISQDCVSIKIREASIEKLRSFLEKHEEKDIDKPARKGNVTIKKSREFDTPIPKSMQDAIPEGQGRHFVPTPPNDTDLKTTDLLDEANALAARFKLKGYRLDITIHKIYEPV